MADSKLELDFFSNAHLSLNMCSKKLAANSNRNIRIFRSDDLGVMADWWAFHRKDDFFPEMLSDLGIVVESDMQEAIGFLYETNSPRCFADFCVVNPALSKAARNSAIGALMDALIGVAASRGFKVMEITVRNKSLLRRCLSRGFIELGSVKYMGRQLCLAS